MLGSCYGLGKDSEILSGLIGLGVADQVAAYIGDDDTQPGAEFYHCLGTVLRFMENARGMVIIR